MSINTKSLNNIKNEIIIGLSGSLGVDFNQVSGLLLKDLSAAGYYTHIIRIAGFFPEQDHPSKFAAEYWKMQYGTKNRRDNGSDYWAKRVIKEIFNLRPKLSEKSHKIAYIVRSLKNKEELDLLSTVYGKNFIAISVYSSEEESYKYLKSKISARWIRNSTALKHMQEINRQLNLNDEECNDEDIVWFLLHKDQAETQVELQAYGQNLFKCYSNANFFIYKNKNLEQQLKRFTDLLFNYPFAEPSQDEYFMFCAQACAYRSLDVDRQVGAVIVNPENELVASGFNDVTVVGELDYRDFKQKYDYGHMQLDDIANKVTAKLNLDEKAKVIFRQEINGITEYKRSTHAEMSAILDASRRGVSIRNCTMYVNYYPCHNCTKHIIASGIKKVVFLHPYTKSKAREMYDGMIKHGLFIKQLEKEQAIVFEPFLGVSPNRFMVTFANDKDSRLERIDGKETGRVSEWKINQDSIPRDLVDRQPYSYITREWAVINNKLPDVAWLYRDYSG